MRESLTIHYPVGSNSTLTGQTKQDLNTSLYRLIWNGTLWNLAQDFSPAKPNDVNFSDGTFILVVTPNIGVSIDHVRKLVEELLIFHPGATLQP